MAFANILHILPEHAPSLRRAVVVADSAQTLLLPVTSGAGARARRINHGPRTHSSQVHVAPFRLVAERVAACSSAHLFIIPVIQLPLPAPTPAPTLLDPANADVTSTVPSPTVRARGGILQPELLLLVVPAVIGFVPDARVPGLVRIQGPETASVSTTSSPSAVARRFVRAAGRPSVPEPIDLGREPALDAAWSGSGSRVGTVVCAGGAREGI